MCECGTRVQCLQQKNATNFLIAATSADILASRDVRRHPRSLRRPQTSALAAISADIRASRDVRRHPRPLRRPQTSALAATSADIRACRDVRRHPRVSRRPQTSAPAATSADIRARCDVRRHPRSLRRPQTSVLAATSADIRPPAEPARALNVLHLKLRSHDTTPHPSRWLGAVARRHSRAPRPAACHQLEYSTGGRRQARAVEDCARGHHYTRSCASSQHWLASRVQSLWRQRQL